MHHMHSSHHHKTSSSPIPHLHAMHHHIVIIIIIHVLMSSSFHPHSALLGVNMIHSEATDSLAELSCVLLLVSLPINLSLVLMPVCHLTTLSNERMLIICWERILHISFIMVAWPLHVSFGAWWLLPDNCNFWMRLPKASNHNLPLTYFS